MDRLTENKIVLIVRETRLGELRARFATKQQAKFYVARLGGDFGDYECEDATYQRAINDAQQVLSSLGRVQVVQRAHIPNFVFGPEDLIVALGQDGLVANTLKYLDQQLLIGVNPDPKRWDGQLLPFRVEDLESIVPEVFKRCRPIREVTMAEATLNTGLTLRAVNDLFLGTRTHGSARYTIAIGGAKEVQSSSGVIVSTGLGSTGWFKSLITGAINVSRLAGAELSGSGPQPAAAAAETAFDWAAGHLFYTVREPFPTRITGASLVFGRVTPDAPLAIESHMGGSGVIFSDGIESDFLEFNSGTRAVINLSGRRGHLVT